MLFLSLLGMPVGLPRSLTLREEVGGTPLGDRARLVRIIAVVFLVAELAGTAFLTTVFVPDLGWGRGCGTPSSTRSPPSTTRVSRSILTG